MCFVLFKIFLTLPWNINQTTQPFSKDMCFKVASLKSSDLRKSQFEKKKGSTIKVSRREPKLEPYINSTCIFMEELALNPVNC